MKLIKAVLLILFAAVSISYAKNTINIVTTTTDLADIAKVVGGDKVAVLSLSHGDQSGCNSVEPRPSMLMALRKADLFVRIGMGYDSWADSLLDAAGNSKILFGASGYSDTSVGILRLEVPKGKVDAGMGHVHIYGNPHYWLDPENGAVMAKNICGALVLISPENKDYFEQNSAEFVKMLGDKIVQWKAAMARLKTVKFVSYHKSWEYFAKSFGLELIATIEPKPGIPPSASHLNTLIKQLAAVGGFIVLHENIYPIKASRMVAKSAGGKVFSLPIATGAMNGAIKSYIGLFDYITEKLTEN